MGGRPEGPIYIGCATDSKFVEITGAMLSSVDDLADLPEAIILVADFGLDDAERASLRRCAGHLGQAMRFIPVVRHSSKIAALPAFDFPLPLLGRMIIPREIKTPRSRLLLLDSDMVVNASLRPLIETDMGAHAIAAVEDFFCTNYCGRKNYFNAGLMLVDVDNFNERDVGGTAMRWLASQPDKPDFLDQDALNAVTDGSWLRLDRKWNYFHAGDHYQFQLEDYQRSFIVHYAGHKTWDGHPAAALYNHHFARSLQKRAGRDAEFALVEQRPVEPSPPR